MKKLMFSLAVAGLCGAVFADVEGQNIVGYMTAGGEKNQWKLHTVQFTQVGDNPFCVQDFVNNLEGTWYDDDDFYTCAPMMQIRNADNTSYEVYYYLEDGKKDPSGEYVPGWADMFGEALTEDVEIPVGTPFWLLDQKCESTSSMTIPGQVLTAGSRDKTATTGWRLFSVPYPKAVSFAEIDFGDITGTWYDDDDFYTKAPMMQVRNADNTSYEVYYYLEDGKKDPSGEYVPGWADMFGEALPDYEEKLIGAGKPFWINLPDEAETKSFTMTFTK